MVQTYEASSAPIVAAARYDRAMFLRDELPKRKALGYPPYVRMANILVWGKNEQAVSACASEIEAQVRVHVRDFGGDDWRVYPASACVLEKLRNTYRWHVLVKAARGRHFGGFAAAVS